MSKHQQVLDYIRSLPVGDKISVRQVARVLKISDGTAYRAIKQAEEDGLVSTIERVGTIRIETKENRAFERLTFEEVVNITDGDVLGGEAGISKSLEQFLIGAMTVDAMERYFTKHAIMIVGNRQDAQRKALESGMAVLITGGFKASQELIDLANAQALPLISTAYDTFTVASILNKAMVNQLIKKKVTLVRDIYTPFDRTAVLNHDSTVEDYRNLSHETGHSRFPVIHQDNRLIGIITAKDTVGKSDKMMIERVITRDPAYTKLNSSVSSVAHLMIWHSLELLPVVQDNLTLVGILSREDVMKAMQIMQRQPQNTNTVEDLISEHLSEDPSGDPYQFKYQVNPQMTNHLGTISLGVLSEVLTLSLHNAVFRTEKARSVIDELNLHYFKMIQIDSEMTIKIDILDRTRKSIKADCYVYVHNQLYAKAFASCQLMDK
ncbi:DRTGG domain-containing protein [Atopobacter phocae]|uniref:DRTGG domain-containing protein n=1 Tax=Atopobacter phocae TaxID=136492 RepID=UPI00046FECB7|nr:DRTGG domain-containing protein [Atopobacter phocae]